MEKVSRLEAESLKLCGYKIVKTKRKYYLTGSEVSVMTGYRDYL